MYTKQIIIAAVVGILIGMIMVGVPTLLFIQLRERAFRKLSEAYERIIAKGEKQLEASEIAFLAYRNREYAERNLPPEGVDMLREHNDRRELEAQRAEERRNNPRPPTKIGVVDHGLLIMDQAVASGKYPR